MFDLTYCEIAYLCSYIAIISLTSYLYIHKPHTVMYGYVKNILYTFVILSIVIFMTTLLTK